MINVTPLVGVWIEIAAFSESPNTCWVTPLVGVWIEILAVSKPNSLVSSLPLWECGLKYSKENLFQCCQVTPLVGVWIEMTSTWQHLRTKKVTPLVGVWIEIS